MTLPNPDGKTSSKWVMDEDPSLRRVAHALAEMGHALGAADDPQARLCRVLELTSLLVPYRYCGLLRRTTANDPELLVVPDLSDGLRATHQEEMVYVLRLIEEHTEGVERTSGERRSLTLPVIGLDEVLGMLRVDPPENQAYGAEHVRLLSVVAAQLGAYLTMLGLRERETARVAELEAAHAELAAAHDFQQLLVGVVSHDLRNPLGVVITVAQSLQRAATDERQVRGLSRAVRSAQRASRIINDLLDVTHVRVTGGMQITRQRVDLRKVLLEAIEDLRLANPGCELRHVVVGEDAQGEWDPDRLTQAVTNLVNNAVQHGDPTFPITVSLEAGEREVVLATHNRGSVIPAEVIPSLFDPFKRGSQGVRKIGGGLGLGLYIVEQIVRSHGGSITTDSSEAQGTTFRLRLPRQVADGAEQGSSA